MKMCCDDVVHIFWQIKRLRRAEALIINGNMYRAVANIFQQIISGDPNYRFSGEKEGDDTPYADTAASPESMRLSNIYGRAETLAGRWFTEAGVKRELSKRLMAFDLDETSIEGEAIRLSLGDIQELQRTISSLEKRRARALVSVAAFRSLVTQDRSNSPSDGKPLENGKSSAVRRFVANGE